jgi:uncharacterized protein Usg
MRHIDIELLTKGYRLTTAEILYHMPDFPKLLQTFVWQELDVAPQFPILKKFLNFWETKLDGKLHSVKVASCELIKPSELTYAKAGLYLH